MKTKRKSMIIRRKPKETTKKQASDSLFISMVLGVIVGHYLTKNPDLVDVITRVHAEYMQKLFEEMDAMRGAK